MKKETEAEAKPGGKTKTEVKANEGRTNILLGPSSGDRGQTNGGCSLYRVGELGNSQAGTAITI